MNVETLLNTGLRNLWYPVLPAWRLQAAPLQDAVAWLETYRRFWEDGFDRLEARLEATEKGPGHG
jgi:hypothetical protein